jgi:non-heme chloroperoxidase
MSLSPALGRVVVVDDGVSLPYVDRGSPTGSCVVLVHGLGDSWRSFEAVLEHLPDRVRALVPSLRGHGDADRPESGYTPADFVSDLVALLDHVGVDEAVVAGHSSGAQLAQLFAVTHPRRTLGIVLVGAPGAMGTHPGLADLDRVFSGMTDPLDPAMVREFTAGLFAGSIPEGFLDQQVAESLKVPARVIRATWAGIRDIDISGELGRISAPMLVVWGDQDRIAVASREVQDQLVDAIPDTELVVYPGVGHSPHWEQPARFVADLTAFVDRLPS